MRQASPLVALILLALPSPASAQESSTNAPEVASSASAGLVRKKVQLGFSFLPMALGKFTYADTDTTTVSTETYFAYGFGLSAGYEVVPGLVVGLSPQVTFNVQPKPSDTAKPAAAMQVDFLARVAYELRPVDSIAVYGEVLPGYSLIVPPGSDVATGLLLAVGVGCAADVTDRYFLNVGWGYQLGFQNQKVGVHTRELSTNYLRVAVGGGLRF